MENYSKTMFPSQKVSAQKKTKKWREACVDYIISSANLQPYSGTGDNRLTEMQTYYDLYNSIYNEADLKYVTNPFKQQDGFPASARDFNIIRPKIDLLIGEETKRPFNMTVVRTSDHAASELQEKGKQMLLQYMMGAMMANMSEEDAARFQQGIESGEIQTPEQIQRYITRDYKDAAEITAFHTLNYLYKKLNIDHEFMKTWKDGLIAGEEIVYVGVQNGEPVLRHVNPMYFSYEYSPDIEFIDDANWAVERLRMAYTEVYDMLYDKMSNSDLDKLIEKIQGRGGIAGKNDHEIGDYNHIRTRIFDLPSYGQNWESAESVDVWHVCWKSFRKIGFVTILNPDTDEAETITVDEAYVVTGEELDVAWEWVIDVWEGYRIGDDLYVGIQPLEYQHVSYDNPNSQKLPYTGAVYSNTNSNPKSLVSLMKPLQYMYIILWYRLELMMARDKGKILNMDVTQIPKSMDIDFPRWAHMLSSIGINLINPYEEGWDIPGREGGRPAQFNQISSVDLTMGDAISQYIELMFKIEDMVAEISGVTKQRQGAIASNELVGNVERSVVQSAHITEPLFWLHNQVKKRALTMLLNTAKAAWMGTDKHYLHYIMDDGNRAFLTIPEGFYEDMDVFVSDSTEDQMILQQLQSLYQPAMQNGASLLDIAEIMTLKNISMIKEKLTEIDERNLQRQQEAQQSEQEAQMQLQQMQAQVEEQKIAIEQQKMELDRYRIDQDNATKIAVAEIQAFRFQDDLDVNNDGTPDPVSLAELALKRQDEDIKQFDVKSKADLKREETRTKKQIEDKRIELEREKMRAAKELQKQKDDAALEREKLKAKTARANKVSGEK